MRGMPMSIRTTSGRKAEASSRASSPSWAVPTSLPRLHRQAQELGGIVVVVDHQDAPGRRRRALSAGGLRLARARFEHAGQPHDELATLVRTCAVRADVPPCIWTSALTRARPMPSPVYPRLSGRSICTNMSKTRGRSSGRIPMPLSATTTRTSRLSARAVNRSRPPPGVYFAALLSRFEKTCESRARSASTSTDSSGSSTVTS